jgi:hypothetical protein
MGTSLGILILSALALGIMHTALGPDHYLPFIALSKARNWSTKKTVWITLLCGFAHVFSSIIIGLFGIGFGVALKSLEMAEAFRGDLAAWLLTGCGLAYMIWGLFHAMRHRDHHHVNTQDGNLTPWALFIVFVFGPCEPLIPVLMFPAATLGIGAAMGIAAVFAMATLATMLTMVLAVRRGLHIFQLPDHRFVHAMAGCVMLLCGVAVLLGL